MVWAIPWSGTEVHFPLPSSIFGGIVLVNEDRFGTGEWRVEFSTDDGGCYITIFAGPAAGAAGARIISPHSSLVV